MAFFARRSFRGVPLSVLLLWGALAVGALVLPSANTGRFASPDETAVAVSIQRLAETGSARVEESLTKELPWLHPRSYLASGDALLPVGFLGWPWWLAQVYRVVGLLPLAWLASLFAVSGAIPWYFLVRTRFGERAAWWGTALAWTFPPVLLYVNRSLFSHMPQYSAALWGLWIAVALLDRSGMSPRLRTCLHVVAGALGGIALSFRPIEAIWLVPLLAYVYLSFGASTWRTRGWILLGVALGLLPLGVAHVATYGSWSQIGYWIRPNPDPFAIALPQLASTSSRPWYYAVAPYGLHPRNVLWNLEAFFLGFLWPWVIALVAAVGALVVMRAAAIRRWFERKSAAPLMAEMRRSTKGIVVVCFVAGWLLAIYGSGLYTDHVRFGAVTVANSFLRYTIPFGFLFAWAMAWLYGSVMRDAPRARRIFSLFGLILLVSGVYGAYLRDEEGILVTRGELVRYAEIHAFALTAFKPGDVILSERSDKIFFPALRVVAPLPTPEQVRAFSLTTSSTGLGLFTRPLSFTERDAWRKMGYDVSELRTFGRERLYRLTPFLR